MLNEIFNNSGTAPLDRMIQFTETRHKVLANNLANIDTPDYVMQDMNVKKFQQDLKKAIDRQTLDASPDQEDLTPATDYSQYLLFHDQNNRSIEKQVAQITENTVMHNVSVQLLKSRYDLLEKAIALKP
jgi:flagellar basal-body rod protein FlgB